MNKFFITFLILALTAAGTASAYVASSTNYRLERDSINFAGGLSTSTNYGLEDTAGEVGTGLATSTNYTLYAGYQQLDSTSAATITITSPSDVSLSPNIDGAGQTADGSASWTVTTTSSSGYTLSIKAAASPALSSGGGSFSDYTESGANPDFTFSVDPDEAAFGYSPEGTHVATRFKDNGGGTCGTGSSETSGACWDGLTTSAVTIAQSASANSPSGTATTVKFRAATGSSRTVSAGDYSASLTLTATAL